MPSAGEGTRADTSAIISNKKQKIIIKLPLHFLFFLTLNYSGINNLIDKCTGLFLRVSIVYSNWLPTYAFFFFCFYSLGRDINIYLPSALYLSFVISINQLGFPIDSFLLLSASATITTTKKAAAAASVGVTTSNTSSSRARQSQQQKAIDSLIVKICRCKSQAGWK